MSAQPPNSANMDLSTESISDADLAQELMLSAKPGTMDLLTQQKLLQSLTDQWNQIKQLRLDKQQVYEAYLKEKAEWEKKVEVPTAVLKNIELTRERAFQRGFDAGVKSTKKKQCHQEVQTEQTGVDRDAQTDSSGPLVDLLFQDLSGLGSLGDLSFEGPPPTPGGSETEQEVPVVEVVAPVAGPSKAKGKGKKRKAASPAPAGPPAEKKALASRNKADKDRQQYHCPVPACEWTGPSNKAWRHVREAKKHRDLTPGMVADLSADLPNGQLRKVE